MSRSFDGVDDYLTVAEAPVIGAPLTLSCWSRATSTPVSTEQALVCVATAGSNNNQFRIERLISAGGIPNANYRARTSTNGAVTSTQTAPQDSWVHITGVEVASNSRRVHVDGAVGGTDTTSIVPSAPDALWIGRRETTTQLPFPGLIAHVALWDVALSTDEVSMLGTHRLSPLAVRPQNLVFYSPWLGRDASEMDVVGGRVLTVSGATASTDEPPLLWVPGRKRIFIAAAVGTINTVIGTSAVLLDDGAIAYLLRGRVLESTVQPSDSLLTATRYTRSQDSTVVASDSIGTSALRRREMTSSISIADQLLAYALRFRLLQSDTTITDDLTATTTGTIVKVLTDTLLVSDEAPFWVNRHHMLTDAINTADSVDVARYFTRLLESTSDLSDEVLLRSIYTRLLEDPLALDDSLIATLVQVVSTLPGRTLLSTAPSGILLGTGPDTIQLGVGS